MISGNQLRLALLSGTNAILNQKTSIDELNIFPVPDGDTGTNMSMTISAASDNLSKLSEDVSVAEVASTAASALLRGARGNSGVILSLLFRGFARGMAEKQEADAEALVSALEIGVDAAYKAVMKPTEGTILTVARVAAENGRARLAENNDPVAIWETICEGAQAALLTTPDLLPVLKKAGVVDAGGKGLTVIFDGMLSVLRDGVSIERNAVSNSGEEEDFFRNAAAEFDQEITFTYCTEFIVGRNPEVADEPAKLRAFLETIGDCVLVVDDDEIIKVHVHTENPGNALEAGLVYGQLLTVKIENMKEQHRKAGETAEQNRANAEKESAPEVFTPVDPEEGVGFVSVAAGDGLKSLFVDLGCNQIVSGGQTMNPSTEDIAAAVKATPATTVFVLPNNKNILMSAQQAVALCPERQVIVLNTRTIPQGLSAMLAYDADADVETNEAAMTEAASRVATGQITYAARDSEFGGFKIKEGDILALSNGKLEFTEHDPVKAAYRLTKSMVTRDTAFITVIYGEDITEEQAESLLSTLENKLDSGIEITLVPGQQPVYHFIISIE